MKYMFILIGEEGDQQDQMTPEQMQEVMDVWDEYSQDLSEAGAYVSGDGLQPSPTATTVKIEAPGEHVVTDGPFAETKEQVGGFYVINVRQPRRSARVGEEGADAARRLDRGPPCHGLLRVRLRGACRHGCLTQWRRDVGAFPAGVGARSRNPDPRPRRLRSRRGRGSGGLRDRRSSAGDRDGVPDDPAAWIIRVGRNRAIDRLRRERNLAPKLELIGRTEPLVDR